MRFFHGHNPFIVLLALFQKDCIFGDKGLDDELHLVGSMDWNAGGLLIFDAEFLHGAVDMADLKSFVDLIMNLLEQIFLIEGRILLFLCHSFLLGQALREVDGSPSLKVEVHFAVISIHNRNLTLNTH